MMVTLLHTEIRDEWKAVEELPGDVERQGEEGHAVGFIIIFTRNQAIKCKVSAAGLYHAADLVM
jgi:hypothetical protein